MNTTILILARNAESTIYRSLHSLYHQSDKDFKVLIVDDASTDGTLDIIKKYMPKVGVEYKILEFSENLGIAESAKLAYKYVDKGLLCRLDADDELPNNAIASLKSVAGINKIAHGFYTEVENGRAKVVYPQNIYECIGCATMAHTYNIDKCGGYVSDYDVGVFIEYDLYSRLLHDGTEPSFIDHNTYFYHRQPNSITRNDSAVNDSFSKLRNIWGDEVSKIRGY